MALDIDRMGGGIKNHKSYRLGSNGAMRW